MKETVNVKIASQAFMLDVDAYDALRRYMSEVEQALPAEDASETMADIEQRICEIFNERLSSPMMVVTLDYVRSMIEQLGQPEEFGGSSQERTNERPTDCTRYAVLRRSRIDRSIAGVCGGIGRFFDIDPTLVRAVMLIMLLFGGLSLPVYPALWIIIPKASVEESRQPIGPQRRRKLYRSQQSIIAGVWGGTAEYFGLDAAIVRVVMLALMLFGGLSLWIYLVLWIILPVAPKYQINQK